MWLIITTILCIAQTAHAPQTSSDPSRIGNQPDFVLATETVNFAVRSHRGGPSADQVARECESMRKQQQAKWLGEVSRDRWEPQCQVVLHAGRSSYANAVGPGGVQTSGSSMIETARGRIVRRRIDLLVDSHGRATALPHELTHVVLMDRFGGRQLPRWADEGMATLADSAEKRALHHRDCWEGLKTGKTFPLVELFALERVRSPEEQAAFYGQSLTLVNLLVQQNEPAQLVHFVELALDEGYDRALKRCYGIDGIFELERMWRTAATLHAAQSVAEQFSETAVGNGS